jgi:rubrerythrin
MDEVDRKLKKIEESLGARAFYCPNCAKIVGDAYCPKCGSKTRKHP